MLFCVFFYQLTFSPVLAVKAYPFPITVTQPDGSKLTILLQGDEFHHYKTSEDGYLLKSNANGYLTYATVDSIGTILESNIIARNAGNRTASDLQFLKKINKAANLLKAQSKPMKSKMQSRSTQPQKAYPLTGTPKSLVILVNFFDKSYVVPTPQVAYTNLLNQDGYSTNGGTGSARDYFLADSYGQFAPNFDVVGPFTLPQTLDFYGKNDASNNDTNPLQMIIDACTAANSTVDFTQYDTDNDGVIDNVFVYYAGFNEAEGAPANTIWPHRWGIYPKTLFPSDYNYSGTVASVTFDTKRVMDYACTSELRGTSGSNMCGIGTFSHEFGHVLGLPDFYDTSGTQNNTLDYWEIMDAGAYNNQGRTPPTYSCYERFFLGWLTPQQVSTASDLTLLPISQLKTPPANKLNQSFLLSATTHDLIGSNPTPKEFFMVEYRPKTGWDTYLPAEGMCIWHVDYDQTAWDNNEPNNYTGTTQTLSSHMRLYLVPPTGVGTTPPTTAFTSGSYTPTTWAGVDINRAITAISKNTDNITFKLMGGIQGPTISNSGTVTAFSTVVGTPSVTQSISVTGSNLTGNVEISLTEKTNFDIKLSTSSTWVKNLSIAPSSGAVNETVQIRYNPGTAGIQSDIITLTSAGATAIHMNLTGTATIPYDPNAPAIIIGKIENSIQFPAVKINKIVTKTFNVKTTNITGTLTIALTGTNLSIFNVSSTSLTKEVVNALGGTNITVTYQPTSVGTHTATLTISGGGLIPAREISLQGIGF